MSISMAALENYCLTSVIWYSKAHVVWEKFFQGKQIFCEWHHDLFMSSVFA